MRELLVAGTAVRSLAACDRGGDPVAFGPDAHMEGATGGATFNSAADIKRGRLLRLERRWTSLTAWTRRGQTERRRIHLECQGGDQTFCGEMIMGPMKATPPAKWREVVPSWRCKKCDKIANTPVNDLRWPH